MKLHPASDTVEDGGWYGACARPDLECAFVLIFSILPTDPTRITLLARIQNPSDHLAWEEFESQYRDLVIGYCFRRGLQSSDAEDVFQIVMVSLSKRFQRGFEYQKNRGRFRTYLGAVVANAVSRFLAQPNRQALHLDTEVERSLEAPLPSVRDLSWEDEWTQHHFRRAMKVVRESFEAKTMAIFDRLLAGESVAYIVERCAVSPETVYKAKQRVRDRLQESIAAQIAEEEQVIEPF